MMNNHNNINYNNNDNNNNNNNIKMQRSKFDTQKRINNNFIQS